MFPHAIVLDMNLPDHTGLWALDRLKRDRCDAPHSGARRFGGSDHAQTALSMGAIGVHPEACGARRPPRSGVEDRSRSASTGESVDTCSSSRTTRGSARASVSSSVRHRTSRSWPWRRSPLALAAIRERTFDCIVTDLSLPDASGFELLEKLASDEAYAFPPVIVYTGRSLTLDEEQRLRKYSSSIIVKGARSPERLLDEVTLFLHQVESELPAERQSDAQAGA